MNDSADHLDDSPQPSARLAEAMRQAYGHQPTVPADVDRAILATAGDHLTHVRKRTVLARIGATGLAAAAAVVLGITLWTVLAPPGTAVLPGAGAGLADVDRSGRVDIIDAWIVARSLNADGGANPAHDVTDDGRVDQADVDAIAQRAVALDTPVTGEPQG